MTIRGRFAARTAALAAALLGAALAPQTVAAQQRETGDAGAERLLEALRQNRRTLAIADGRLSGDGAELLLSEGRASQFFLLGEEHGVAEVPALAAALFRELTRHGYRHLAIETGDGLAVTLDTLARKPEPLAALTAFFQAHWPGAPSYTLREEAELLVEAVAASPARQVLWGLDYDIMADRHALPRLRELASTPAQREAAGRAIGVADSLLRLAMEQRNPGHVMMFGGPESVLQELRFAYAPGPGTEAERIVSLLEATRRINGYWLSGEGWRSNEERARWNKRQFARLWHDARQRDGEPPRVMLKFGANHMIRGRTWTDVYDLGSLASELADALGGRSFHVLVVGGRESSHAVLDPTVMEYRPAPSDMPADPATRPFFDAADPAAWTLYDLRPLRPLASQGRFGDLPEGLAKVIWGFDAVVVVTGSRPATMLPIRRPW